VKRDPRHTMLPSLAGLALLAATRPLTSPMTIHIGLDDYEPLPPRPRKDRKPVEISPLTGKQTLANPTSNRKAEALKKAMRRQARTQPKDNPNDR
jgi:hypothetical protein